MPLPLILIASAATVGRFIATKGLQKAVKKYGPKLITKGKKYIKDNKLVVTGKNTVKTGKGKVTKVTNASKRLGGGKKINTTPKKKITATNTNASKRLGGGKKINTTPKKTNKNTGPSKAKGGGTKTNKNTGPNKAKGGSKISGPTKGLIAVGTTVPFLFGNKSKDSSTNKTNPKKDRDFRKSLQQDDAYSMDKMLDKKQEKAINNMDRQKRESQSIGGGFGAGVNFSSKDVSKLKENARKLTSQINNLDITSMQKKRLKDELNTRKKNFGMGESYQKSFDTIRNKVKNKKFN